MLAPNKERLLHYLENSPCDMGYTQDCIDSGCPYAKEYECYYLIMRDAAELIRQQDAEIARLTDERDGLAYGKCYFCIHEDESITDADSPCFEYGECLGLIEKDSFPLCEHWEWGGEKEDK